jgi:hypothetical protein
MGGSQRSLSELVRPWRLQTCQVCQRGPKADIVDASSQIRSSNSRSLCVGWLQVSQRRSQGHVSSGSSSVHLSAGPRWSLALYHKLLAPASASVLFCSGRNRSPLIRRRPLFPCRHFDEGRATVGRTHLSDQHYNPPFDSCHDGSDACWSLAHTGRLASRIHHVGVQRLESPKL